MKSKFQFSNKSFSKSLSRKGRNFPFSLIRPRAGFAFVACLGIWLPEAQAAVLVDLDAAQLPEGPLASWPNSGTLGAEFVSSGTPQTVVTADGVKGVQLSNTGHYVGPVAPFEITGPSSRTIEAWVLNPSGSDHETIIAWGRRGGPDGSNNSFSHGVHPTWGAFGGWGGGPDMSWNGNLAFGRWTYIVYTYDAGTLEQRGYFDGELANSEPNILLDTWAFDDTADGNPLPIRVGAQNNANGSVFNGEPPSLTVARIRVHDVPLTAEQVQARFDAERETFGLVDRDGDGLPDWYEDLYDFLDPNNPADAAEDFDGDGLTNLEEFEAGTDPSNPDTDGDGLNDGDEINVHGTDPLRADTDGDGLSDGAEINIHETDPLNPDTDGDGFGDFQEVIHGSDPKNAASVPAPDRGPIIRLETADLEEGSLDVWPNKGPLPGDFVAPQTAPAPVRIVQGIKAVSFNGSTQFFTGPAAPGFMAGNSSRTVEAWIMNPAAAGEETIFSWGRRGGPAGTNTSFNHGTNADFGAVGHWGAPDIGWGNENNVVQGQWTYVVYTYDSQTQTTRVYSDGFEANFEELPDPLNTHAVDTLGRPLPFRIASQNEANGNPTAALRGSMSMAEIRVYDRVLDPGTIQSNFEAGRDTFGLVDYDNDGLPTWYERLYDFLDERNPADADQDFDGDGLSNLAEFHAGTDPSNPDTDGDGLNDGDEVNVHGTNPFFPDTDQDGLTDGREIELGTDPLNPDTDFDGYLDGQEVAYGSDPKNANSIPNFSTPVAMIDLDATELPAGPLEAWPNNGALGGSFQSTDDVASVQSVDGVKGVTLDGVNHFYTGPSTPLFLAGDSPRTVEGWIFNPQAADEETIFAWGRRGGPDGTNASFNHGMNPVFGAVGHWGAEHDIGWNDQITSGAWTHVAYTYDPLTLTTSVYKDGVLANSETYSFPLSTWATDNAERPLPFRLGAQNDAGGSATATLRGSMTIAKIRVYDRALSAEAIAARFAEGLPASEEVVINEVNLNRQTGEVTLTWDAAPGKTYAVEVSTDLETWSTAASGLTSGSFTENINTTQDHARFFRLRIE
jgi:hypothetical protein